MNRTQTQAHFERPCLLNVQASATQQKQPGRWAIQNSTLNERDAVTCLEKEEVMPTMCSADRTVANVLSHAVTWRLHRQCSSETDATWILLRFGAFGGEVTL